MSISAEAARNLRVSYNNSLIRIAAYLVAMIVLISAATFLFGWGSVADVPAILKPASPLIMLLHPYLPVINGVIIFILGYMIVGVVSRMVYTYMRNYADHAASTTVMNITKIFGIAVLLAVMTSVFSVDTAAVLTIGSFSGLVVGFAFQTLLGNTIAGIFILLTRPFTFGDTVTIMGQTGVVREIRLLHLVLETPDSVKDIYIPNNTVLSQVILKERPGGKFQPIDTRIELDEPPRRARIGETVTFTGVLTELPSLKPLPNTPVRLMESDITRDDILMESVTDAEGRFSFSWAVVKVDMLDMTAEIYARFIGDEKYHSSNSKQHKIEVYK